jgi:hypothetical protein
MNICSSLANSAFKRATRFVQIGSVFRFLCSLRFPRACVLAVSIARLARVAALRLAPLSTVSALATATPHHQSLTNIGILRCLTAALKPSPNSKSPGRRYSAVLHFLQRRPGASLSVPA